MYEYPMPEQSSSLQQYSYLLSTQVLLPYRI